MVASTPAPTIASTPPTPLPVILHVIHRYLLAPLASLCPTIPAPGIQHDGNICHEENAGNDAVRNLAANGVAG